MIDGLNQFNLLLLTWYYFIIIIEYFVEAARTLSIKILFIRIWLCYPCFWFSNFYSKILFHVYPDIFTCILFWFVCVCHCYAYAFHEIHCSRKIHFNFFSPYYKYIPRRRFITNTTHNIHAYLLFTLCLLIHLWPFIICTAIE